ncbi:MAG TPA: thiamine pyrophosphate-dependent dehydrogenase E1 component subunit alpha, partial [Anaerolineales bacterium]|nr:thiamine pyrophosphate-dependent dehydrogenase E1 component subunit alpha [Anaerolineales bacterium]
GVPHAAGSALASQLQKKDTISIAFFGEGAVNQGVFLETLNLAVIWKLPLILVCENNLYSEMTPSHETTSVVETYKRAAAFGFEAIQVDGNDVETMYNTVEQAVGKVRAGEGPVYIEAMTYRLWGHMMGDPEIYRTKEEVAQARKNEPIVRLGRRLLELGYSDTDLTRLDAEAEAIILDALQFAEASPVPKPADAFTDVFI